MGSRAVSGDRLNTSPQYRLPCTTTTILGSLARQPQYSLPCTMHAHSESVVELHYVLCTDVMGRLAPMTAHESCVCVLLMFSRAKSSKFARGKGESLTRSESLIRSHM